MPVRATTRGTDRTDLTGNYDAIICGASFAGLTVARELSGLGKDVLVVDRYEIGERQTSACATPTSWLEAMGLTAALLQTFDELEIHTPHADVVMHLPWSLSTFDYRRLCELLWRQGDARFETAKVDGLAGPRPAPGSTVGAQMLTVATDRGELSAPIVVDAMGWRRVLGAPGRPPTRGPFTRGLEVHPAGHSDRLETWVEPDLIPAGYGWSFPAHDELRIGTVSFDPADHVKKPTVSLAERLNHGPDGYQGNWIPHRLREATEGGVFFVGDSAGQCLPLTAEGIRTAFYFGIAAGREARRVLVGQSTRQAALRRYGSFSARHRWQFESLLRVQRLVPKIPPRLLARAIVGVSSPAVARSAFTHYLRIAHPAYVGAIPARHHEHDHVTAGPSQPTEADLVSTG